MTSNSPAFALLIAFGGVIFGVLLFFVAATSGATGANSASKA